MFFRFSDQKKFLVDSEDEFFSSVCDGENTLLLTLNGSFELSNAFGISRISVDDYETISSLTAEETARYLTKEVAVPPLSGQSARLQ